MELNIDSGTILFYVVIVILLILLYARDKNKHNAELEKQKIKDEYEKILYRYKDFEGNGIDKYLEKPEERIMRIYNHLDNANKQKLVNYAETLEKREREEHMK